MDHDTLHSIGDLARLTGATVKTIRYYSDCGLMPPAERTAAGYRLYDHDAVSRLDLVRTLRELGLDLATIRTVMERDLPLPEIAAAHVEALDVQMRLLRLRRAVLTAVAKRGATPEETHLMHKRATLSESQRRGLIDGFLDAAFGGVNAEGAFTGICRSLTPELPEDPDVEQAQAWVELAEMLQDSDFRVYLRGLAECHASDRLHGEPPTLARELAASVRDQIAPAVAAGIDPASPEAASVLASLMSRCTPLLGCRDDAECWQRLLARLDSLNDPRRERYLRLLAVINDWLGPESLQPVLDWSIAAVRARAQPR